MKLNELKSKDELIRTKTERHGYKNTERHRDTNNDKMIKDERR